MKHISLFLLLIAAGLSGHAQSAKGLTGKRDTSYSTYSAYINTKKDFPDIKIVTLSHPASVEAKMNIPYCKIQQRTLVLDAFSPRQKSSLPHPAVLIVHGGGWRSGDRSQHYPLAEKLASLGYACYTAEYRLSTEALYPAAVNDLKSALRWMHTNAKQENIDTNRIAILGFSAGGELAAFVGTTAAIARFEGSGCNLPASSQVKAIVDIDGTLAFVHPESGEGDDSRSTSAATYWFGYSKNERPGLWKDAAPLTHVGKNTPPILFINSSVDRMHAGRQDFIKVLDEHQIYSEIRTFPNAPHSFCLFEPWFEPTVSYIDNFLKKVLKIH